MSLAVTAAWLNLTLIDFRASNANFGHATQLEFHLEGAGQ